MASDNKIVLKGKFVFTKIGRQQRDISSPHPFKKKNPLAYTYALFKLSAVSHIEQIWTLKNEVTSMIF